MNSWRKSRVSWLTTEGQELQKLDQKSCKDIRKSKREVESRG